MVGAWLIGFRARLQGALTRAGLALPWWVAVSTSLTATTFTAVAAVQRAGQLPPALLWLACLLTLLPMVAFELSDELPPAWWNVTALLAAVAILLSVPVVPDFAPVVLIVLAAQAAATGGPALALVTAGAGEVLLGLATELTGLVGSPVYLVSVLLGLTGGLMLRWYMRALEAERAAQETTRQRAVLAERQHIAREVHDVVAHSLSITLLHLTGARRALQQDRDVDDAIDALTEAEQVGRAAMADIRRTVGLLAATTAGTSPLPGADDIAALVDQTRAAGLDVRYEQHGDLTAVSPTAGLGLYRIAQESLANVVKHAPDGTTEVRLLVDAAGTRLTVRNDLRSPVPRTTASGSGLAGMSARAAQLGARLHAGPSGGHWLVSLTLPGD